jgi:hypothetical protein
MLWLALFNACVFPLSRSSFTGAPGVQEKRGEELVVVYPYMLLEHVVRHHGEDVRELDLSLVPFNDEEWRMLPRLLREVFERCTKLERLVCLIFLGRTPARLGESNADGGGGCGGTSCLWGGRALIQVPIPDAALWWR